MARPAVAVIWAEAPGELRFLTGDSGFCGPERTAEGVAYHRPGLHVDMGTWTWKKIERATATVAAWSVSHRLAVAMVMSAAP